MGFGSSQDLRQLGKYQDDNDMPFLFAEGPDRMAPLFDVRTQSTKFGLSSEGVIQFRHGYSSSSAETWAERLASLTSS